MLTFNFSELSQEQVQSIVKLHEKGIVPDKWDDMMLACTDQERQRLQFFTLDLLNRRVVAMNEATIWSRAIYPLLMLAEQGHVQAWSQVLLRAQYPRFALEGIVDGVLANSISGRVEAPYLVVLEAKRAALRRKTRNSNCMGKCWRQRGLIGNRPLKRLKRSSVATRSVTVGRLLAVLSKSSKQNNR